MPAILFGQLHIWKELRPYHFDCNRAEIQAVGKQDLWPLLCLSLAKVLMGHLVKGVHPHFCCVAELNNVRFLVLEPKAP